MIELFVKIGWYSKNAGILILVDTYHALGDLLSALCVFTSHDVPVRLALLLSSFYKERD